MDVVVYAALLVFLDLELDREPVTFGPVAKVTIVVDLDAKPQNLAGRIVRHPSSFTADRSACPRARGPPTTRCEASCESGRRAWRPFPRRRLARRSPMRGPERQYSTWRAAARSPPARPIPARQPAGRRAWRSRPPGYRRIRSSSRSDWHA